MEHGEQAMAMTAAAHGTFEGHVLPGSLLILWALIWMAQRVVQGEDLARARTLETGLLLPVLKVSLPLIGVWVEIPPPNWGPTTTLMNLQHVTMYSTFVLTGVVDLLARRNLLPASSTYVAFAITQANAGFLFWGHTAHGGVEDLVHRILAGAFFVVAGIAVAEAVRPSLGLGWLRIGSQLVLGGWFILGAWVLYLSGWELTNPVNEGRSSMIFSWLVMLTAVVVASARVYSGVRAGSRQEIRVAN